MLLVTVETVAAELEKYRALVEISSCNQTVVSDVFQLQVVQDDSKGLGGAVARFTEVNMLRQKLVFIYFKHSFTTPCHLAIHYLI